MPWHPFRDGIGALAVLALAACGEPALPPPPAPAELSAAARHRLDEFASPASWQDLDAERPGTRLRDPRTGIVFRRVPKGEFDMGDDGNDPMWRPRHRVVLSRDYLLAETELTVGQWQRCAAEFALDPGVPIPAGDAELPMTLSCLDAEALAQRFGYRLPTEAEWERACGGGLPRDDEPWRKEAGMREYAWFHRNSMSQSHAVATRKANPFGLYDMLGNLWEWCGEDFDPMAYGKRKAPATDPYVPPRTRHRVLRGGSWFSVPPASPRTRFSAEVGERTAFFGARFACDAPQR
ncbi:MAG: SUMF1/EgtB/PvdO family nonheme iron enzyme [Planctomycetes bacterium]|nr:SUMF1/EgtB/PvdO family nonheme iron enzyme [Planctomycetota bacterium]